MNDIRPANCRFRLQDERKPYPRSSCPACGRGIATGLGARCHLEGVALDAAAAANSDAQWNAAIEAPAQQTYEAPRNKNDKLVVRGVGRVADEPRSMIVALNEIPTDDEIRSLHDFLRNWPTQPPQITNEAISADAYPPAQEIQLDPGWLLKDIRKAATRMEPSVQHTEISDEAVKAALDAYWQRPMDNEHSHRMRAAITAANKLGK